MIGPTGIISGCNLAQKMILVVQPKWGEERNKYLREFAAGVEAVAEIGRDGNSWVRLSSKRAEDFTPNGRDDVPTEK